MTVRTLTSLALLALLVTCKTPQPTTTVSSNPDKKDDPKLPPTPELYQASATRTHDLLHTKLEVSFDWKKQQLNGQAYLQLKTYFYPTNELVLDAKGFDIHEVSRLQNGAKKVLPYEYDNRQITITLDQAFTRKDTFEIFVKYTAKPEELDAGGSAAISSDKGLYFINHDGKEPGKMPQIWTQGETEASSCWFPTIDKPNEKMTQELFITVDKKYNTLSNGLLIFSTENGDGTRTDYWKQDLPHAPYLVMMGIGEFVVVEDVWRDSIPVNYYVEKEWAEYAEDIFGDTPEMMEFFSTRLGVDYPWQKYSQIVVRDYVSGAMENTTATIHGDFLYRNRRQLLDSHNESIIAHELFHHWFGDYVTCESWSNLPLNESFANYSQYLWDEYKHGNDEADFNAHQEMSGYLMESRQKQVDLIRFDYLDKEDMFDGHSYNKGGRILHMLRHVTGDDAFFESLRVYLENNKFKPAEVHNLRLAFEEVTGEDYNWFFNQWFLASGHPVLDISYEFDTAANQQLVIIEQKQNFDKTPLYRLPMEIDVYESGSVKTYEVEMTRHKETFRFDVSTFPDLVNVDAQKVLLCEKEDRKTEAQWAFQYANGPRFLDRREALVALKKSKSEIATQTMVSAINDKFWGLQIYAMKNLKPSISSRGKEAKEKMKRLTASSNANLRSQAINTLSDHFGKDTDLRPLFEKGVKDSSYAVMAASLRAIKKYDPNRAYEIAMTMEDEQGITVKNAVANIYADQAGADKNEWFMNTVKGMSGFESFGFITTYSKYLKRQDDKTIMEGLVVFENQASGGGTWWMKMPGYNGLSGMETHYTKKRMALETELESKRAAGATEIELSRIEREINDARRYEQQIRDRITKLQNQESDPRLKKMFGQG